MKITFSFDQLLPVAASLWEAYPNHRIWVFDGPMGAGKTTFIDALCKAKGVEDATSSPTFSIINEYRSADALFYHMDLYRLKSVEEAFNAGVEECIYHPQAYCFIEWPVWVESMLPEDTLYLYLEPTSDGRRTITISTELQRPFMLIPQ